MKPSESEGKTFDCVTCLSQEIQVQMQNATLHCHHETDQGVDTFLSGGRGKSTFMPNIIPHHCIHYDLEMEEKQNEEKNT